MPSLLEQSLARSADALARAERLGDPVAALLGGSYGAVRPAVAAGDIDEVDRCLEIMRSLAEQLDQPTVHWMHTFMRAATGA